VATGAGVAGTGKEVHTGTAGSLPCMVTDIHLGSRLACSPRHEDGNDDECDKSDE
jgi:hypothetical protein